MECVQLAAAFAALRPIQTFGHSRKRQQAARTPYASRGSVTDTNNRTLDNWATFCGASLTARMGNIPTRASHLACAVATSTLAGANTIRTLADKSLTRLKSDCKI